MKSGLLDFLVGYKMKICFDSLIAVSRICAKLFLPAFTMCDSSLPTTSRSRFAIVIFLSKFTNGLDLSSRYMRTVGALRILNDSMQNFSSFLLQSSETTLMMPLYFLANALNIS